MQEWILPEDIAKGIFNLPPISINTQNSLRAKKKIQYTKIGRNVYYKREWIEEYINSNIRLVHANNQEDAHAS